MSDAITQRANIDKKFADLEEGYAPYVKVGYGRKHELKTIPV